VKTTFSVPDTKQILHDSSVSITTQIQDGRVQCETCNVEIADQQDIELCSRIGVMLMEEESLARLYNNYRLCRGLELVNFEKLKEEKKPAQL